MTTSASCRLVRRPASRPLRTTDRRPAPWPASSGAARFEARGSASIAPEAGQRVQGRSAIIGRMARHDHSFFEGGIYEDCAYHPVLCTKVDEEERDLEGISLIDGSLPRSCSIDHCGPELLSVRGALLICMNFEVYKQRRIDGLEIEEALVNLPRTTLP